VISTLAWEGFHEAVEDVRYLTALQKALLNSAQLKRCGDTPCSEEQAAQAYLQQLKQSASNADPATVRDTVIDHLLALMAPLPPTVLVYPTAAAGSL